MESQNAPKRHEDDDLRVETKNISYKGDNGNVVPMISKMNIFDETDIADLQSKVQEMATKEIERRIQTNAKALTSTENPAVQNMPFNNVIDISLQGLDLPPDNIVQLEGSLREIVKEKTKRTQNQLSETSLLSETTQCVYTPVNKGTRVNVNTWSLPADRQETEISMSSEDKFRFWWADNFPWAPQQLVPGVGTSHGPSIAVYNGRLFMVWKGIGEDPGIYYTTFYNNQWAPQQLVPGVGTSHGPSIAVYEVNGRLFLFMVWKGVGGDDRVFYTTKYMDDPWAPQARVHLARSHYEPSIAVYNRRLFMVVNLGNAIWFHTYYPNQWAPQHKQVVINNFGVGTSHGPSVAAHGGRLFMVWKGVGTDNRIWYSSVATNMSLNEMWVGLNTGGSVTWPKEIQAWNDYPPGRGIGTIQAQGSTIRWLYIVYGRCQENTQTIVFRKPKVVITWWWDMYNLDESEFWFNFGGKSIRFTWIKD